MVSRKKKKIAVIGAGVSGIAAARVLVVRGYETVVFDAAAEIGGVWALTYPEVRLQNIGSQYHLSDFPWPFAPDLHPTPAQIRQYWRAAIDRFQIEVRLEHEVLALEELESGWRVRWRNRDGVGEGEFDYAVVATGQYTRGKPRPKLTGEEGFGGTIVTEREIHSPEIFDNRRVAVVGFGKSALDMTVLAARRAETVTHIFREPRWLIPERILGLHYSRVLFNRLNTVMIPAWAHPTAAERFLHDRLDFLVRGFWKSIGLILRLQARGAGFGRGPAAGERLKAVQPTHGLLPDLRSAAALAPDDYYPSVAAGRIQPHRGKLSGFTERTLILEGGEEIPCDVVVFCLGVPAPAFPFLPEKYRALLESEEDGVQLYRHLLHPRIPNLAFAGFNHGFLHVPAVEIATLWLCAYLEGDLELPSSERMEGAIAEIRRWKRERIHFETTRSAGINVRYQQYLDILLKDLGLSPYRKMPNVLAEIFDRYNCSDYRDVLEEYERVRKNRTAPRLPLDLAT